MNICVFLGSKIGNNSIYKEKIVELGTWIASNNHTLVFGGSKAGLMGILAITIQNKGGKIIGIEPKMFDNDDVAFKSVDEYIVVETISERKDMLINKSDVFIMFPGGMGTLEEFSQIASMNNIGITNKKVFVYNINGYYDNLKKLLNDMTINGFYSLNSYNDIIFISSIEELDYYFNKI